VLRRPSLKLTTSKPSSSWPLRQRSHGSPLYQNKPHGGTPTSGTYKDKYYGPTDDTTKTDSKLPSKLKPRKCATTGDRLSKSPKNNIVLHAFTPRTNKPFGNHYALSIPTRNLSPHWMELRTLKANMMHCATCLFPLNPPPNPHYYLPLSHNTQTTNQHMNQLP
jgi:hypothetical protein